MNELWGWAVEEEEMASEVRPGKMTEEMMRERRRKRRDAAALSGRLRSAYLLTLAAMAPLIHY